jgi:hypothetical protein
MFGFITLKKEKRQELESIKEINGREIRINLSEPRKQMSRGGFGGNNRGGFKPRNSFHGNGGGFKSRNNFGGNNRSGGSGGTREGGSSERFNRGGFKPRNSFSVGQNSSRPNGFGKRPFKKFNSDRNNSSK